MSVIQAICAYYAGIMLNGFATYYAHNYAGIIGSSLVLIQSTLTSNLVTIHVQQCANSAMLLMLHTAALVTLVSEQWQL